MHVLSNIWVIFEAQFIKNLSNTEAKLKKTLLLKTKLVRPMKSFYSLRYVGESQGVRIVVRIVRISWDLFIAVLFYFGNMTLYSAFINPFHATDLFWYPLKTSENLWFSDVFRGYQKRSVAWNELMGKFVAIYKVFPRI